ncbi:MAG: LCP family protein [Clostridia bacterium]|nr:LCP family protein [Clostridia bacterium]
MSVFGRKKVSFMTEKQSAKVKTKKFITVFAVGAAVVLALSLAAILGKNDFNIRAAIGGDAETKADRQENAVKASVSDSDKIYFLWVASKDRSEMRFIWLVRVQMPEARFSICTVNPESILTIGGKGVTFEDIYAKSGEKELVAAMKAYSGLEIDKYIGASDENFKALVNYLGGVQINVPEQIEYKSEEFNTILVRGMQNMKGDTLFRYLRYLGVTEYEGPRSQSKIFGDFLKNLFSEKYVEKRSNIFSKISNSMITNISIVDFSSHDADVKALMESGIGSIDIVSVPSELAE